MLQLLHPDAKAFFNQSFFLSWYHEEYPKESLTLVPFNANLNCTIQDLASWWCVCRRTLLSAPSAHPWKFFDPLSCLWCRTGWCAV